MKLTDKKFEFKKDLFSSLNIVIGIDSLSKQRIYIINSDEHPLSHLQIEQLKELVGENTRFISKEKAKSYQFDSFNKINETIKLSNIYNPEEVIK